MAPALSLLGPPALHQPNPSLNHPSTPIPTYQHRQRGQDLKSSLSPLDPCTEFLLEAIAPPQTQRRSNYSYYYQQQKDLTHYERQAWKHNPLTTLKLICSLRIMGKLEKDGFYKAMLWVHKNHPLTISLNVMAFGGLGMFKDLLGILYRVLEDSIERSNREYSSCQRDYHREYDYSWEEEEEEIQRRDTTTKDVLDNNSRAKTAVERYQNDSDYRNLHDRISEMFAEFLRSDLIFLESGEVKKISFASKFCPSVNSSYDKATLICENIAKRMFPRHSYQEYKDVEEAHYAYRVRERLRKQVLIPLHKALKSSLVEMKDTSALKNNKAFNGLKIYKEISKNDGYQNGRKSIFQQCMKIVDMFGNSSVGDGLKLPNDIVASLMSKEHSDGITDLQWRNLVQELSNQGKLRNCLAVCDIPSNMRGRYKETACISLGLLISELSENPWKGKIFSFNETPTLQNIEGDNLRSKCEFMRHNIECGDKVDFFKIYDRVLQIAIKQKLSNEQLPPSGFLCSLIGILRRLPRTIGQRIIKRHGLITEGKGMQMYHWWKLGLDTKRKGTTLCHTLYFGILTIPLLSQRSFLAL